jgi:hypothetical protein
MRPVHVRGTLAFLSLLIDLATIKVVDVAQALVNLMHPSTFTIEGLLELVQSVAYLRPSRFPHFPKPIALAIAKLAQAAWFPMVSPDEIERRYINDSDVAGDWEAFGVRPDHVEDHALVVFRRFRSACVFLFDLDADVGRWVLIFSSTDSGPISWAHLFSLEAHSELMDFISSGPLILKYAFVRLHE